jgi:hypothetical protein
MDGNTRAYNAPTIGQGNLARPGNRQGRQRQFIGIPEAKNSNSGHRLGCHR